MEQKENEIQRLEQTKNQSQNTLDAQLKQLKKDLKEE